MNINGKRVIWEIVFVVVFFYLKVQLLITVARKLWVVSQYFFLVLKLFYCFSDLILSVVVAF